MRKRILALTLALCLCLTLLPMTAFADGGVAINGKNFPDDNFREYVKDNFDTDEDDSLSAYECAKVKSIYVSNKGISSLQGIEYFTALTTLDCNGNALTSLDVTKNTALIYLYCSGNDLTSLDVSKNAALTTLHCYDNKLTSLDVTKNTALINLNCSGNALTSLDVSNNTALQYLYCSGNALTSLDVSHNTKLNSLYCGVNYVYDAEGNYLGQEYNHISELDVSKNTALRDLYCSGNALTSLDVTKNAALTTLRCYDNKLTSLDVSKNAELDFLRCEGNDLTSLDVSKNTALTTLQCFFNDLTELDVSKNTALKVLWCYGNALTELDLSNNQELQDYDGSSQSIALSVPLNGYDLGKLIGSANLSRITRVEGGSLNNGIICCEGGVFTYYYDTKSNAGNLQVVLTGVSAVDPQSKFTDAVPETHWAHDAIDYVVERHIMSGMSETTFEPNGTLTRAMVVNMLYNLAGEPTHSGENKFTDVPAGAWYADAVLWASESKIVSGKGDGIFDPNGNITREQLAIMMQNYAKFIGKDTSASEELDKFEDADTVSSWAIDAVKWACANKIVSGSRDGSGKLYLDPKGNATRAHIAVIFENFCKKFGA